MEHQLERNISEQGEQVISTAEILFHNQILGIYLYGSATMGGLHPDSDIDILIITTEEMSDFTREIFTEKLLNISGLVGCRTKRPLEVTVVNQNDITPWHFPPKCEYMYGEWLREEIEAGKIPQSCYDPDIAILLWQARKSSVALKGAESKKVIPAVPFHEIKKAIQSSLPYLIDSFEGDERNVLLTLARMWYSLETGEITSKDVAAEWALPKLPEEFFSLLKTAKEAYLGNLSDEWENTGNKAIALVAFMKQQIEELLRID